MMKLPVTSKKEIALILKVTISTNQGACTSCIAAECNPLIGQFIMSTYNRVVLLALSCIGQE